MLDLFGEPIPEPGAAVKPHKARQEGNPCLLTHGTGSVGQTCKGCVHLRYSQQYANRHWKCDLRKLTHGAATDHRVNWPACGRYEEREGEYHGG